jgi:hypothetical protein
MEAGWNRGRLMTQPNDSLLSLVEILKRKAPEYLDLVSATTEDDFDLALDSLLAKAISHLERNKVNFKKLNEVGLSAVWPALFRLPGLRSSRRLTRMVTWI